MRAWIPIAVAFAVGGVAFADEARDPTTERAPAGQATTPEPHKRTARPSSRRTPPPPLADPIIMPPPPEKSAAPEQAQPVAPLHEQK